METVFIYVRFEEWLFVESGSSLPDFLCRRVVVTAVEEDVSPPSSVDNFRLPRLRRRQSLFLLPPLVDSVLFSQKRRGGR